GYSAHFEPLQNQRLNRPAGVIEIAAQAPDPPIRSSRKYWINPLFVVHVPGFTYRQGRPRELKDGSVVSGLDNRPKSELLIVGGAPAPTGAVKGVIGASNSTCGSAVAGTVVVVQVVPSLAKYTTHAVQLRSDNLHPCSDMLFLFCSHAPPPCECSAEARRCWSYSH